MCVDERVGRCEEFIVRCDGRCGRGVGMDWELRRGRARARVVRDYRVARIRGR